MSIRVLVTGAGGAAGIGVLRALARHDVALVAADCDPHAAGLYLTDEAPALLPRGDDPSYVDAVRALARERAIDVIIPTVDEELEVLAREAEELAREGIVVVVADAEALSQTLDKQLLAQRLHSVVPGPRTVVLDDAFDATGWELPVIVKPRRGRGGEGVAVLDDLAALAGYPRDGRWLVQENLPGEEYSVDVLVTRAGEVVAAVPRLRLKVDSGVAVAARTVKDEELEQLARDAVRAAGLRGPANVQFRRDRAGQPRLLEINPRFPGTLAITVAAGADLPWLAVLDALGRPLPAGAGDFEEIALVRYLEERVLEPGAFAALEEAAVGAAA